jgi:hypothetical protein
MHAHPWLGRTIAVLTLATALVACGSSKSDDESKATSDKTTTTEKSSSPDSGSGADDFGSLAERGGKATARITYRDADGTEFTLSQDPPKQALISKEGKFISDGEHTVICTGSGNDAQCFEMAQGTDENQIGSFLGAFAAPFEMIKSLDQNAVTAKGVDTSSETIAGRKATCATFDSSKLAGSTGTGTEKVCVDKKTGVLLKVESDGKTQLEATDIGEPKSDDFEPTTTPQTVPSVPKS